MTEAAGWTVHGIDNQHAVAGSCGLACGLPRHAAALKLFFKLAVAGKDAPDPNEQQQHSGENQSSHKISAKRGAGIIRRGANFVNEWSRQVRVVC
jgi:hypothetical protein